tara:strand:+ start:341 stop:1177 length:837 start_codon:yes stop_codon:yes gene_type:complete
MIFISTSCLKNIKIKDTILQLVDAGFYNIELSGGSEYYEGMIEDLVELKYKYNLNYICHNYFPPPKKHFILNLASLDDDISQASINHIRNSIKISKKLDCDFFGFHAGFFTDFPISQIGKEIFKKELSDRQKCIDKFCNVYNEVNKSDINLYIENNVISEINFKNFGDNFFMLTNKEEYSELKKKIDFKLLLDVAHLKVSCKTLNLDFESELDFLINSSNYIHISDNNSFSDDNRCLEKDSSLYSILSNYSYDNKIMTIEVYDGIKMIEKTYNNLIKL